MSADRQSGTTLAPELRALLEQERARPPASESLRDGVWDRLALTIPVLGGSGGGGGSSGPAEGPPPSDAPSIGGAAPSIGSTASAHVPRMASLMAKLSASAPVAISAFVAGIVAGAGAHAALTGPGSEPPPHAVPSTEVAHADPAPPVQEASPETAIAPGPAADVPIEAPAPAIRRARERPISTLAAERTLLEPARSALVRGEPRRALDWLERHRARHPDGSLAEEREVLAVQALVRLGELDDARTRAAQFRSRYPGSLFEPAIAAALSTIP